MHRNGHERYPRFLKTSPHAEYSVPRVKKAAVDDNATSVAGGGCIVGGIM